MTLKNKNGFTLIELMVGMLLTSILLGAVYGVYRVQARTLKVQEDRLTAQEYARTVVDLMVREIRNAGFTPQSAGCAVVDIAEAQRIQFHYDDNNDTACNGTNEGITYYFDGTGCPTGYVNITRQDGANTPESLTDCNVPDGASNFSFAYYPKDSTTAYSTPVSAANRPNIQRVVVTVTVMSKNPDPVFGGQLTAKITSNADLRNRGLPG